MLQQTTVPVVKQRYMLWLEQFPDLTSAARADLTEILRAFEGLGYYARARHLHQTACKIAQNGWPEDYASLRRLPGLGDYTVKTILSRCFKKPVLAFDVNIHRLFSRLYMKYPLNKQDEKDLERAFAPLLEQYNPAVMGQALMRFAQNECRKRLPACDGCFFSEICLARRHGVQVTLFPQKQQQTTYLESIVLVLQYGNEILIEKRQRGIGRNMFSFPRLSAEEFMKFSSEISEPILPLQNRMHTYTRYREKLIPYFLQIKTPLKWDFGPQCYFEKEENLKKLPFMAVYRKILESMAKKVS